MIYKLGQIQADVVLFNTIIDTVLATYKTTGDILCVGLDSSSMLDFVMDSMPLL